MLDPEALAKVAETFADLPDTNDLTRMLKVHAILAATHAGFSQEELVLRKGHEFTPAPLGDLPQGEPQGCFKNALLAVLGDRTAELVYVEGFACRPPLSVAIHHAWVTRPGTNEALDVTWDDYDHCLYHGIEFSTDVVLQAAEEHGCYGYVLHDAARSR